MVEKSGRQSCRAFFAVFGIEIVNEKFQFFRNVTYDTVHPMKYPTQEINENLDFVNTSGVGYDNYLCGPESDFSFQNGTIDQKDIACMFCTSL